jgi:hypothetical protein
MQQDNDCDNKYGNEHCHLTVTPSLLSRLTSVSTLPALEKEGNKTDCPGTLQLHAVSSSYMQ